MRARAPLRLSNGDMDTRFSSKFNASMTPAGNLPRQYMDVYVHVNIVVSDGPREIAVPFARPCRPRWPGRRLGRF
ncbi:hypothetical protein ELI13_19590 [Rhizobium ruizarguesonis]|uniref:Uncharacterized protein n=1 Tax=Rhizobium ruizarguesonis TaxID=2081791 RepID=A0ABY1XFE1_9HYPH|nr:hypothetical protein [Rhizobium ruizarguesonis]TAU28503.1 hypothetical protein ELI48_21345 [Rhizobium ruizarguesonis]TAU70293.1 hypothetical protein ELI45_21890 [Rhizobium ruizarguesonis]TAU78239.1 hypothetical protein ELI46_20240 [Rhizobium ruizarguesonis]TAV17645.1 hypothetical protein ELI34_20690 [Rhizobium ruizarguesonis]